MNCPVCHTECVETFCPNCGFTHVETPSKFSDIGNWVESVIAWCNHYWESLTCFEIKGTTLTKYFGTERKVVIPHGITKIGEKAFSGINNICEVVLPDTIKEIG